MKAQNETYDDFYRRGGWSYDAIEEANFLRYRVLLPLGLRPGCVALELGCGLGVHAFALQRLGLRVTAVDSSAEAIRQARALYSGPHFVHADATAVLLACPPGSHDLVFARGMSWFHYEFEGTVNRKGVAVGELSRSIMSALRPDGCFVLQIRTDFTGRWDQTGIRNHTYEQVHCFFDKLGHIVAITDWCGLPLLNDQDARASGRNLLIAVRSHPDRHYTP